jgi:perosamine synthetase
MRSTRVAPNAEQALNNRPIPWGRPTLFGAEESLVLDALRSTWIAAGPYIERLEREIAERLRARHAVAVSSGTTAVELALRVLDLEPGAEVIVPSFTFVAPVNMVLAVGVTPVYADITPDTWLLDPAEIHRLRTPRTKVVIPVHLYGNVADMDSIVAAASESGLEVLEDAAEAAFSCHRGRAAGTIGRVGTLSFHAAKTITTGEGGMVITGGPVPNVTKPRDEQRPTLLARRGRLQFPPDQSPGCDRLWAAAGVRPHRG